MGSSKNIICIVPWNIMVTLGEKIIEIASSG
jgi:hypothetical protein